MSHRFPLADVLWTLAMACNVFMIVFYRHDAAALRKLERIYIGVITALVFIPAFTFLFIHTPERGPMYGSVTVGSLPELKLARSYDGLQSLTALVFDLSQLGPLPNTFLLWAYMVCLPNLMLLVS